MRLIRLPRAVAPVLAVPALALAAALLPAPATARADVLPRVFPGAALLLTIHHGRLPVGAPVAEATLRCLPAGGSHPHPRAACAALLAVDGHFGRLRQVREEMCPLLIDPVTVTATGRWLDRPVAYLRTFPNRCVAARQTAGVFAL